MQTQQPPRRRHVAGALLGMLFAGAFAVSDAQANEFEFTFLGEVDFAPDYQFDGTTVGGLSGITYDWQKNVYYAISDDRSQINPARFYTIAIDLSDGLLAPGDVTFEKMTPLLDTNGQPFAALTVDPEAIRIDPAKRRLYWTSEGDANALLPPFVREMKLDGTFVRELSTPAKYFPTANHSSGIRNNLAFESLTFLPGRSQVVTATENALYQDGAATSVTDSSPSRILVFDTATGTPIREYVYDVEPVVDAPVPAGSFATNGLVDFVATGPRTFITMERSFSTGVGNVIRLYLADATNATDVSGFDSIEGHSVRPVKKRLLADLAADFGIIPDNVEGITYGPKLADGSRTLVLVADDNFSPTQITQFLAFSVKTQ